MYLVKTPNVLKPLASDLLWSIDHDKKNVYLTFDDGPTPEITQEILKILNQFNARATFFCVGKNVKALPDEYAAIISAGHRTGNHTWDHLNGWVHSDYAYLKNVLKCDAVVSSSLFRPPYGKIKRSQVHALKRKFSVVMWDVLSADWSKDVSREKCLKNVTRNTRPGSIVVFHDSEKAKANMLYALPRALEYLSGKGLGFKALPGIL